MDMNSKTEETQQIACTLVDVSGLELGLASIHAMLSDMGIGPSMDDDEKPTSEYLIRIIVMNSYGQHAGFVFEPSDSGVQFVFAMDKLKNQIGKPVIITTRGARVLSVKPHVPTRGFRFRRRVSQLLAKLAVAIHPNV